MNRNWRKARHHACPFKVKLTTEQAPAYLLAAQKDTTRYKNPQDLELYFCDCGFWHVGHKKGSKKAGASNPV